MTPEDAYNLLVDKLSSWLDTAIQMLPNFALALIVLIVFYVVAKIIKKSIRSLLQNVTTNRTIVNLLESILGFIILAIGIFIALSILQLDGAVTSLLAGAGVIGLALGFAFQDIASNFISGIILSIRHPFGIGDVIESNDYFGTVEKLNLRNTILKLPQGQIVYIPNKMIFENPLENFTKTGERRIDLACGVSYGENLERVQKIAVEAIDKLDKIKKDRDIQFMFNEFGDSSINFEIRYWISYKRQFDYFSAQSDGVIALKKAFDENDIMIPFPIRTLDFGIKGGEKLNTMINFDKNN